MKTNDDATTEIDIFSSSFPQTHADIGTKTNDKISTI